MRRDPKAFRERFNAWKNGQLVYLGGRPTDLYLDTMEGVARLNADNWGMSEDEALIHALNDNTYDYQGYYDKYPESSADSRSHWTDEFKTVYHPTFSNESKYHGKKSLYNPHGLRGGMWIGDKFLPATWQGLRWGDKALHRYKGGKDEQELPEGFLFDTDMPELTVTGYAPLRLTTYYPVVSKYPFTGHSELKIPIDLNTWYNYVGERAPNENVSPYMVIDKMSNAKDYNLITNNCADATLNLLNKAFNTSEKPWMFTTPGDVRDYALKKLNGKLIKNNDGSDTVLIPRNKNNAKSISTAALDMFNNGTSYLQYHGRFGYANGKDEDDITTLREITVTPNESYAMASSDDMRRDLHYNIARAKYKNNLDAYNLLRNMNAAQEGVAMNFGLPLVMGLAGSPIDIGVEGAMNLGKAGLNLLRRGGKSLARVGGDIVRLGDVGLGRRFKQNYYTDFITGESIAPAYIPTEYYPKIRPIDDYIGTSLSNSTVPRMAAQRPKMSPRQVAFLADRAASGTYFEFPEQAYIEAGKKNVGGLYNPRKNYISIREGRADEALTHEVRHRLDQYMPLTESELKYLNDAFTSDFDAMTNLPAYKDVDLGAEKVTTIGDARRALLGDQKDWGMPWTQQNIEIDKARDVDVIDALLKSNGYGRSYVEQLKKKYGSVPTEVIKAIREAMKYVGVGSGVAVLKPKSKK